jgi:Dioxygenase
MKGLWTAGSLASGDRLRSPAGGLDSRGRGPHAPRRRCGAVLLLGIAWLGLVGCDAAPRREEAPASTSASTAAGAAAGCAPTRGEAAQGGAPREVAADAPSKARLGPGGEVRRTAETVAKGRGGQRLVVSGTVYRADCRTPLAGASIAVWQTNAEGEYGPGQGTGDERCCYLGAALRADERGRYELHTVKPGHYKGEPDPPPAHIHFEVLHPDAAGLLTELLFEGDPHLPPDPPGAVTRPEPVPGSDPPLLRARFDIVLGD